MAGKSRFDYLVKQHSRRVYNYAIYMTKNVMDAEDITQEVLLRTWQNVNKFNFLSAKAWMMRTTHNLCIDYLRRNKKTHDREIEVDQTSENLFPALSADADPIETVVRLSVKEEIIRALEQLPARLKSPFVLYEIQGFKYREIGNILDMPTNTVKVNILRARKELQKHLREYARDNT
jgi:RNA polymerase sigma-70 factor, ECF subfamily